MIAYTIVPTNGNTDASVAQPTSIGSSIRRRASLNVQKMSATQTTRSTRSRTLTAVLRPSLLMPKTPRVSIRTRKRTRPPGRIPRRSEERPPEEIPQPEEDEDHERHHDGDERDHLEHPGAALVHRADRLRRPGAASRSATR